MNNPSRLSSLIKDFDIADVEKALVCSFAAQNGIVLSESKFLSGYIAGYSWNETLMSAVGTLGNFTIEDLSVALELLIPEGDRIVNGAFFTPAYIVDYIIGRVAPSWTETLVDPSCGSGAFLLGALRYFKGKFSQSVSETVRKNIYGADILDYNIRRAKVLICLYGLCNGEIIDEEDIHLTQCDSLRCRWTRKFDCVVGNPPYVKFQDMNDETRRFLSANWMTTTFGTYNLYFAFFELGYNLLSANGRLGYITPNNYFTSLAGEALRSYFQNKQCIYQIVDFASVRVFDVQTYTAITFMNRAENDHILYGRIRRDGQTPMQFLDSVSFSPNKYGRLNKKKWRLLCGDEQSNIYRIETAGDPIGELFDICAGIATLKDDVYSFKPKSADKSYFYFERDGLTWRVEKDLARTTVKISDMKSQRDIESNNRHFIFPYRLVDGKMTAIPLAEMQSRYPCCYAYFDYMRDVLASRGKGKHVYTPFYSYGRSQCLNRHGVKIYTPTFSKTPRFLFDSDEDSLFTNGYGLFFKGEDSLFGGNPISSVENVDVVQKILNSGIMHYYITATSVAIDGGYPCYQKNFIEKFSIPYLNESQIDRLRELSDMEEINAYLESIYQINLPSPNLCS